jgi:hypothetical protein
MPGPSAYIPTSTNIAQYYRPFLSASIDVNGNITYYNTEEKINHGICMGCTYTFPFAEVPMRWFPGNPEYYRAMEHSKDTWRAINYWSKIGPGRRATQPFTFNTNKPYEFLADQIGSTYQTANINYYIGDWGITGATGKAYSPWGLHGACAINRVWQKVGEVIKNSGVTLDYVLIDKEGDIFGGYAISTYADARAPIAIRDDPRYQQPWEGLSSWQYYFEGAGGFTTFGINNKSWFGIGATNYTSWNNAATKYDARMFTLAHYYPVRDIFPNVSLSNYNTYTSDGFTAERTGIYFPNFGENVGNAASTVNYTSLGGTDAEQNNQLFIQADNSSAVLVGPSSPLRGLKSRGILLSYRMAFLVAVQLARETHRNSPNFDQHPWIGAVNMWTEGYPGTVWTIGSSSQSDENVLRNSWNKQNISTTTTGITAPDGTTSAYLIRTENTSGATCSLDYFLYGVTPGITYTFSYFIDLSRGFTAPRFRIQHWKKYNSFESTGQGLTYTQTLPIGTGPFFQEKLVGFSSGDSGWTKVAFEFQGTTNPTIALSAYYARNDVTTGTAYGFTSYIWNPELIADLGSGMTALIGITAIDARRYEVSMFAPSIAYADATKGYNPKLDAYFTRRGGNSAYYYEMLRHQMLLGTKAFGYFNGNVYIDYTLPGLTATPNQTWNQFATPAISNYRQQGGTSAIALYRDFNNCLGEVNTLLGGYTATTAIDSWGDWLGSYIANGAPVKGGTSWLWRVTSLPGYTTYCNGETLSPYEKVGTWVTTSGATLAGVDIYSTKWALPQEPGITSPTVDFNFLTMSSVSDLTSLGFTFIRGSTATYINNQGKLVVVSGNTPRFSYDPETLEPKGLLIEPSGINNLNWSESFANTGGVNNNWIDFNLQRTLGNTSPSDSLNAILFSATGANATLLSSNSVGFTRERCLSFWMKGITGNESVFYTFNNGITWNSISQLSTSWKRFEYGPNVGDQTVGFRIGNTGNGVYIWGAQLEKSKSEYFDTRPNLLTGAGYTTWTEIDLISSSYIPTQGATAQRNNEELSMPVSSFSSWLGLTQGSFVYEAENMHQGQFAITRSNITWYGLVLTLGFDQYMNVGFQNHPTYNYPLNSTPFFATYQWGRRVPSALYKIGINYRPSRFGIVSNGVATSSSLLSNFPGFETTYAGGAGWLTELIFTGIWSGASASIDSKYPKNPMYLRRLRYWNTYFPESLLQVMTVANMEIFSVDNSVEYTWERFNALTEPYTFTLENSNLLT